MDIDNKGELRLNISEKHLRKAFHELSKPAVYVVLTLTLYQMEGETLMSMDEMASFTGLSPEEVRGAMQELLDKGWLGRFHPLED